LGQPKVFFIFCKPGHPAHINISKVSVTLIKLDFMEGGMNTVTVAKLEKKIQNRTGG